MILISNHRFSTPNRAGTTSFPLINEGQVITHKFDIVFSYDFNSTPQSQFEITQLNQITGFNVDFTKLGVLVGDSLKIDAVVTGGTDIDVTGVVAAVTANTITFTTNIFTNQQINELFPLIDNAQMFIVNQTRTKPLEVDIFYNLVENSVSGNNQSLWDSEVNRFKGNITSIVSNGDFVNLTQLGNKSGGAIISAKIELVSGNYEVSILFIPWLFIEQNDLTKPTWYQSNEAVKPYIDVRGFSQVNNPNSFIQGIENSLIGNTGWYNEGYNQGSNPFTVQNLVIEDSSSNPLAALQPQGTSVFSFEIVSATGTIDDDIQLSIFSIIADNLQTKNNLFDRLQNSYYSIWYDGNQIIGNKAGNEVEFDNVTTSVSGDTLTVTGELNANIPLTNEAYRLSINVNDDVSGSNVTVVVQDSNWEIPPLGLTPLTVIDDGFNDHSQLPTDTKTTNYSGTTEDDFLYTNVFELQKNETITNIRFFVEVFKVSTFEQVAILYQSFFDFSNIVFLNGKYIINETRQLNQFLDSPGRNQISLALNGVEDSTTYQVQLVASLMANWREWVALQNLVPDFYNQTLPQNGQNAEWVNYLRLAGYEINVLISVVKTSGIDVSVRRVGLQNYDDSPIITSQIEVLNSSGVAVNQMLNNQIYTIRATHILEGEGFWNEGTWGWIGLRPKQSEPMKRISTAYDVTQLNAPLEPLPTETRAKITFPSANIAVVECQVNSSFLSNESTFVARIDDGEESMNVTKIDIQKITIGRKPQQKEDTEDCCGEPWLVLADPQDSTTWKNDHTLVFEKATTLNVTTVHNGVESPALGVAVSFPNDNLTRGFVIDWRLYYDGNNELIQGNYDVFVEFTIAGQTTKYFYNSYKLLKYSDANAEGTIRISTIFNKYSELYDTDFSGSGARDTVRLRGFFGYRQPNYETKNNTELSKKRNNVFRKSNNTYQLIIEPTVECKTQRVEQLHLLHASECYISDFNEFNHYAEILELPVILSDDNSPEFDYFEGIGTKYARVLAEFKDKVSRRKSKNNGTGEQVEIPNIGLWEGVVCIGGSCADANYTVIDQRAVNYGSGSIPSGGTENINILVPRQLNVAYKEDDDKIEFTVRTGSEGVYTTIDTTGLTNVVIEVNSTVVTAPITLAVNDEVEISFDPASADGVIIFEE